MIQLTVANTPTPEPTEYTGITPRSYDYDNMSLFMSFVTVCVLVILFLNVYNTWLTPTLTAKGLAGLQEDSLHNHEHLD